jgi:hypothetical protein
MHERNVRAVEQVATMITTPIHEIKESADERLRPLFVDRELYLLLSGHPEESVHEKLAAVDVVVEFVPADAATICEDEPNLDFYTMGGVFLFSEKR